MNKNHEGYTDYTASEAIRRADRRRKPAKGEELHLVYRLEETDGFQEARKAIGG